MGRRIIKQADGQYAVWSTIVDNFVAVNCSEQDIVEMYLEEEAKQIRCDVARQILVADGFQRGNQFTMNMDEALGTIRQIHGEKEVIRLLEDYPGVGYGP